MLLRTPAFRLFFYFYLLAYPVVGRADLASNQVPVSAYHEVSRGPHSRVMQRTTAFTNIAGTVITRTNSYTELETGMSHLAGNQWVPSSDEIQITADGAAATNCSHCLWFSANLNSPGAIDLLLPDGQHMTSDVAALTYFDGTTNVIIATPQDSIGQVLPSLNQVLYTNYFGAVADVLYKNSCGGVSQDIVIHQLPAPVGLTGSNIWVQVWSEFSAFPSVAISTNTATGDQFLDFGTMKMGKGRTFMLGTNGPSVPVTKQWFNSGGRTFLIESVLLNAIEPQLEQLQGGRQSKLRLPHQPMLAKTAPRPTVKQTNLPARKLAGKGHSKMRMAAKSLSARGLVLDYDISGSITNFCFQSDTTYLVTGTTYLYQSCTVEGGSVIKFVADPSASLILQHGTNLVFNTAAYRPALFTASDDDTVGTQISGSSGSPFGYYGGTAIEIPYYEEAAVTNVWSHLRFSFLNQALQMEYTTPATISDAQFVGCSQGIYVDTALVHLRNALFSGTNTTNFYCVAEPAILDLQNVTVHCDSTSRVVNILGSEDYPWDDVGDGPMFTMSVTNCLLIGTTNLGAGLNIGGDPNVAVANSIITNDDTGIFQLVGAGSHYLAPNTYQGLGTTNIDPLLLADLQQRTTYPPQWLTNTITNDTVVSSLGLEDNGGTRVALGYHYDVVDFISFCPVTNATLTLTNGVVLAYYNDAGIWLQNGSQLVSQGTPNQHNYLVAYQLVQEQAENLWSGESAGFAVVNSMGINCYHTNFSEHPNAFLRFTTMSSVNGSQWLMYFDGGSFTVSNLTVRDCEFWGAGATWNEGIYLNSPIELFQNNLFHRANVSMQTTGQITSENNLFLGAANWMYIVYGGSGSSSNTNVNNAFDNCDGVYLDGVISNNAYLNGTVLGITPEANAVTTNITWVTGPLGNFYQPTNGGLVNMGSSSATNFGLYYYTTTTNQVEETNSIVDIGYHYVAVDGTGQPNDTLWTGIPDYLADTNGALAAWQTKYFGHIGIDPNGDYDSDGTNNLQEYLNGTDPNKIQFSLSLPNQYVDTNMVPVTIVILGGVPSNIAVLVDSTNFGGATWSSYTSSNITVNITTNQGAHDVWVGLRGLPSDAQQTWVETTLVLNSATPSISITSPTNNVSFNASRVDVSGTFVSAGVQLITVNGILAFINGTNFEALNVPLGGGSNLITAVLQDLTGDTNTASIVVNATTNMDGSLNDPVELAASPTGGFYPLAVTFQVTTNMPGTVSNVFYDFNGDDIADLATNNFANLTYTYTTNGQFFPVVTVQTSLGRFSSLGGWNTSSLDPSNQAPRINVLASPTVVTNISVTDPVDIKWTASSNLYVLSGSTATITEYDSTWTSIRSLSSIGSNPSGLDVDTNGNVYVAMTGSNQVWRYYPSNSTFAVDTSFGNGGYIGKTNGTTGTGNGQFSAPYDVAVSPDGGTISVSDSGNSRIQQFDTSGSFIGSFGGSGSDLGLFSSPAGLTYDGFGTLYVVDSGNNRVAVADSSGVLGVSGTSGTGSLQFNSPLNVSVGSRGIYVADSINNRIQAFDLLGNGIYALGLGDVRFALSGSFNQPAAVAAVENLTNELVYVADTANNRVLLYSIPGDNPITTWTNMVAHMTSGDVAGAVSNFSSASSGGYLQAFLTVGSSKAASDVSAIGALTPISIESDRAEYYFEQTIAGQLLVFPVQFVRENGVWKILEF